MSNNEALRTLLYQRLDPSNEDHWTGQGLPRVDSVSELLGAEVNREQITGAAPELTKEALLIARSGGGSSGESTATAPTVQEQAGQPSGQPAGAGHETAVSGAPTDEELMDMPFQLVCSRRDYVERILGILSGRYNAALRKKNELDEEMRELSKKSELAGRMLQRLGNKSASQQNQEAITAYLRQSRSHRAEKAGRARRFLEAGTTAREVAEELNAKSKLDQAMEQRKAPLGSGRPAARPPNHQT